MEHHHKASEPMPAPELDNIVSSLEDISSLSSRLLTEIETKLDSIMQDYSQDETGSDKHERKSSTDFIGHVEERLVRMHSNNARLEFILNRLNRLI